MREKLKTLFKQMEKEMNHLNSTDKQRVRKYMMWSFERGEFNKEEQYL